MSLQVKELTNYNGGLALPITLIFLFAMILIGLAAIRHVTLDEKMAGNLRNQQLAFEAAEWGLRYCETLAEKHSKSYAEFPPILIMGPIIDDKNQERNHWEVTENWRDNTVSIVLPARVDANNGVTESSRCMIEKMTLVGDYEFQLHSADRALAYRITSRGISGSGGGAILLQSYLRL